MYIGSSSGSDSGSGCDSGSESGSGCDSGSDSGSGSGRHLQRLIVDKLRYKFCGFFTCRIDSTFYYG